MRLVALNWERVTAGPVGLLITTLPPLTILGRPVEWETKPPFFVLAALLAAGALVATRLLRASRLGAFLVAIREEQDAAEAIGVDTVRAKVTTLALSAFLAGVGGGFYAFYYRYVDPDAVLSIALSMEMVFIAIVGGLGSVGGPLIGAVFLTAIAETVRERLQTGHLIVYGLFMMLVIRYLPTGIWGLLYRLAFRRAAGKVEAHGAPAPR
jgi:branched-chain amino acid transport system permease protein